MKFHVKTASDVLSKGLDPSHPYSKLGDDGMLVVPFKVEVSPASDVISISLAPPTSIEEISISLQIAEVPALLLETPPRKEEKAEEALEITKAPEEIGVAPIIEPVAVVKQPKVSNKLKTPKST